MRESPDRGGQKARCPRHGTDLESVSVQVHGGYLGAVYTMLLKTFTCEVLSVLKLYRLTANNKLKETAATEAELTRLGDVLVCSHPNGKCKAPTGAGGRCATSGGVTPAEAPTARPCAAVILAGVHGGPGAHFQPLAQCRGRPLGGGPQPGQGREHRHARAVQAHPAQVRGLTQSLGRTSGGRAGKAGTASAGSERAPAAWCGHR